MAQVVNIHLPISGELLDGNGEAWVNLLSIPNEDIHLLALRPLKWLPFVTFAICGAKGDLCTSPTGVPVDYESVTLAENYYYIPDGEPRIPCRSGQTIYES
jgi:hypothetical protein